MHRSTRTDTAASDFALTAARRRRSPALPDADAASDDAVVEPRDDAVTPTRRRGGRGGRGGRGRAPAKSGDDPLVREGDVAGDYLERLLDILDVDGDIDLDVEGDRASVAIVGGRLNDLIGPDGATLEALQELTRLAVAQSTGVRSRLMLDVGGFRAKRRADLTALAGETARRVARAVSPSAWPDEPVRAQGRPRRHRRASPACTASRRARSRTAGSWSCLTSERAALRSQPESRQPPEVAAEVFGSALPVAERVRRAAGLRRGHPRADRPARGPPAVGAAHAQQRGRRRGGAEGARSSTWAAAPACPASRSASPARTSTLTLVEPMARRVEFLEEVVAGLAASRRDCAGGSSGAGRRSARWSPPSAPSTSSPPGRSPRSPGWWAGAAACCVPGPAGRPRRCQRPRRAAVTGPELRRPACGTCIRGLSVRGSATLPLPWWS